MSFVQEYIVFISIGDLNCSFPSGPLAYQEINSLRSLSGIKSVYFFTKMIFFCTENNFS